MRAGANRPRPIRLLFICVALGAVGSIAVAWALALFQYIPQYPRDAIRVFVRDDQVWDVSEAHKPGAVDLWWLRVTEGPEDPQERAAGLLTPHFPPGETPPTVTTVQPSWGTMLNPGAELPDIGSDRAFGWPMPCLWYDVHGVLSQDAAGRWVVDRDTLHGGIFVKGDLSSRGADFRALPLRPITLAILADTFTLAIPLWLLLLGIPFLRRRVRHRKGQCTVCGYDLRGDPKSVCPECGSPAN